MNNLLTRKNIEIINLLKKEDSHLRDIAERLKISPGKVHAAVRLFRDYNLINEKREKNRVILSLNKENPSLYNLISIIEERKGEIKTRLRARKRESHKGQNGTVLVIGGSIDYAGAPALAAMAALKTGSDLAIVAAPEKAALAVNSYLPDLITKKLKGDYIRKSHYGELKGLIEKADVIAIGPGLGRRRETLEFVKLVLRLDKAKVIDADAIYAVNLDRIENSIITPHSHEFEILFNNNINIPDSNIHNLNKGAKNSIRGSIDAKVRLIQQRLKNNIILLKGPVDRIISKDRIQLNNTGNEGMTKGGTGDVLAGIAASLISQGNPLFDSACYAAYINGISGDRLKERLGYGFLASEMVSEIPYAMKGIR